MKEEEEPLSPGARVLQEPSIDCGIVIKLGCKTKINPDVITKSLKLNVYKHPCGLIWQLCSRRLCRDSSPRPVYSSLRATLSPMVQVEELKKILAHAKDANDMDAGEVYGERSILTTEVNELDTRLLSLAEERDKSLAVLDEAARSKVFRNMLDSDECKTSSEKSITLPDLNHEELKSLLEFLYSGNLIAPYNQYRALYLAADKYDILYLQETCRNHFIASLTSRNVLDILELASIPSDTILKDAAISHIVKHVEEVVVPMKYETFVQRNPNLSVEITRAYLRETKAKTKDHGATLSAYNSTGMY